MPSSQQPSNLSLPSGGQQRQADAAKIRVEFAININKQDDLAKIDELLKSKGVKLISRDFGSKTVQLELGNETNGQLGDVQTLQRFIEKQTGFVTVVKGLGDLSSAVVELRPASTTPIPVGEDSRQQVIGVIRLSQLVNGHCFIDGTLDGFKSNKERGKQFRLYSLAIHEFGDLSGNAFQSIGKPIVDIDSGLRVDEQQDGIRSSISVRKIVPNCDVLAMIGRSVAVTELHNSELPESKKVVLSAGVIARASTVEANKKQICSCSGKTLWEERLERKRDEED